MDQDFSFKHIWQLVLRNKYLFIILVVLAAACGAVFSGPAFITPLYKSVAVVYPVNIKPFSEESQTEQLEQYFQSSGLRDTIINHFDLAKRYRIDTTSQGWRDQLYKSYLDHVVISKTIYESVRIEVMDEDPVVAKNIAQMVIKQVNVQANLLLRSNAREEMMTYAKQLSFQNQIVDSLTNLADRFGTESKLLDYPAQSREITRGYFQMLLNGASGQSKTKIQELMDSVQHNGPSFKAMNDAVYFAQQQYNQIYTEYMKLKAKADQSINYTMTVVHPSVADKKSYPTRWLIVAISVVATFFMTLVLLLFFRSQKA